ncbi:hypothetical protein [Gordonia sp. 852002-50395_SCH5434458]|uniref:hypothetical protein n=1 Tax=Gordonia sp. 852002-50395_SCH5434458 TaxID=1834090 RepID=UPI0007EBC39A|nr:hypothetical protein [Gordonia sp. 852002-50395_SCH5434458]OBC01736.1 hypothetical protein A5785_17205 [Gordonia sp. 852002-50395_SCH5434458]
MSTHHPAPSGVTEMINFFGAVIVFAGVGAVVATVAQSSAEAAAAGLCFAIIQFFKMAWRAGIFTRPNRKTGKQYGRHILGDLSGWLEDWREIQADRRVWQIALMALAAGVGFALLRAAVLAAMGVFQNVVLTAGIFAIVGGFAAAPGWIMRYVEPARAFGLVESASAAPASVAVQVQTQPTATPTPTPPAPEPAPASNQRTRRRVVKEIPDV